MESHHCDESKCVSKGGSVLHNGSFTCYGDDGRVFPRMCADGFLPRLVGDEPPLLVPETDTEGDGSVNVNVTVHYFTCCPPHYQHIVDTSNYSNSNSSNVNGDDDDSGLDISIDSGRNTSVSTSVGTSPTRHCSDPIRIESGSISNVDTESMDIPMDICQKNLDARNQNHPRRMKPSARSVAISSGSKVVITEESFQCCDAPLPILANNGNSLDETDCVPYQNIYYESILVQNKIGLIRPIVCNYPQDDTFGFPVAREFDSESLRFQCCKEGEGLDPFVVDSLFKVTYYPPIAINLVSMLVSVLLLVGLSIPLFQQIQQGIFEKTKKGSSAFTGQQQQQQQSQSSWRQSISNRVRGFSIMGASSMRASSLQVGSSERGQTSQEDRRTSSRGSIRGSSSRRRSNRTGSRMRFSTYNLYLIILAILDIFHCLWAIYWLIPNQKFNPERHDTAQNPSDIVHSSYQIAPTMAYVVSNMFINSFIANQVLILLRSSHRGRRIQQPTPKRIGIESALVIGVSVGYYVFVEKILRRTWLASIEGDIETAKMLDTIFNCSVYVFAFGPVIYVLGLTFWIWCRYLPPKPPPGTRSNPKRKATRELALYFFRIVAVFLGVWIPAFVFRFVLSGAFWDVFVPCFVGFQPTLTFCVVLTKTDVRNYVFDLVTLSYFRGRKGPSKTSESIANTQNAVRGGPRKSTKHVDPNAAASAELEADAKDVNTSSNATKVISDISYSAAIDESRGESTAINDNVDESVDALPNPKAKSRTRCSLNQIGSLHFSIEEGNDDSDRSIELGGQEESLKSIEIVFEKDGP